MTIPNDDIGRLSTAVAGQIQVITDRLIDVLTDEDFAAITDQEVEEVPVLNPNTGELVVGLAVAHPRLGEVILSILNGELIVQRNAKGRIEYARLDDEGEPGDWRDAPPPPSGSKTN